MFRNGDRDELNKFKGLCVLEQLIINLFSLALGEKQSIFQEGFEDELVLMILWWLKLVEVFNEAGEEMILFNWVLDPLDFFDFCLLQCYLVPLLRGSCLLIVDSII